MRCLHVILVAALWMARTIMTVGITPDPRPDETRSKPLVARSSTGGPLPKNGIIQDADFIFNGPVPPGFFADLNRYAGPTGLTAKERAMVWGELDGFQKGITLTTSPSFTSPLWSSEIRDECPDGLTDGIRLVGRLKLERNEIEDLLGTFRRARQGIQPLVPRGQSMTSAREQGWDLALRTLHKFPWKGPGYSMYIFCLEAGIWVADGQVTLHEREGLERGYLNGIAIGGCLKELGNQVSSLHFPFFQLSLSRYGDYPTEHTTPCWNRSSFLEDMTRWPLLSSRNRAFHTDSQSAPANSSRSL